MTISVTSGAWAAGSTSVTPALPASPQAGDLHVMFVGGKPYSTQSPTPSGWTDLYYSFGTNGTIGATTDAGSIFHGAFYRFWQAGDVNPTITLTGGNVALAVVYRFRPGANKFISTVNSDGGEDTSSNTTLAYPASHITVAGFYPGQVLVNLSVIAGNNATITGGVLACSGLTFGAMNILPATPGDTATGTDLAASAVWAVVQSGINTAYPTVSWNLSANQTGGGSFIQVIEQFNPIAVSSGSFSVSGTALEFSTGKGVSLESGVFNLSSDVAFQCSQFHGFFGLDAISNQLTGSPINFRISRPIPNFTRLKTLDYTYKGKPHCNISLSPSLLFGSLDFTHKGFPIAGTKDPAVVSEYVVECTPGSMAASSLISGITRILTSGNYGEVVASALVAGVALYGVTSVPSAPGELLAEGSVGGCCVIIPAAVGAVITSGSTKGIYAYIGITCEPAIALLSCAQPGICTSVELIGHIAISMPRIKPRAILLQVPGTGFLSARTGEGDVPPTFREAAEQVQRFECGMVIPGLEQITIPIQSFTSRQRDGEASYTEVTIPGLSRFFDIKDRLSGSVAIYAMISSDDGRTFREEILTSRIQTITAYGSISDPHIMVGGYAEYAQNTSPKLVSLSGSFYRYMDRGKLSIRLPRINFLLKPGDTVACSGDSFVAERITYCFSTSGTSFMEVMEGD